jgi:hypothetical protein
MARRQSRRPGCRACSGGICRRSPRSNARGRLQAAGRAAGGALAKARHRPRPQAAGPAHQARRRDPGPRPRSDAQRLRPANRAAAPLLAGCRRILVPGLRARCRVHRRRGLAGRSAQSPRVQRGQPCRGERCRAAGRARPARDLAGGRRGAGLAGRSRGRDAARALAAAVHPSRWRQPAGCLGALARYGNAHGGDDGGAAGDWW